MELDLDRQEPGRSELPISGRLALDAGDDRVAEAELRGDLVIQNIESRFLVNGSLEAVGRTTCGRCLQEFDLSWDVPVDLMVLRNVDSDEEEGETLLILQRDGVVDLRKLGLDTIRPEDGTIRIGIEVGPEDEDDWAEQEQELEAESAAP